jgi:hypothetical protein
MAISITTAEIGLSTELRVKLWDAINRYVAACGGDASKRVYGNAPRMRAVADVERVVRDALIAELDKTDGADGREEG